jgi:hypothetical protein
MPNPSPYHVGTGQEVPLGSFSPDSSPTDPGILLDMQNAQPTIKGFRAMPSPVAFGAALPANHNGSIEAFYSTGASSLIAGTTTHLYRYISGVPVEAAGGHLFAVTTRWRFFQFGDHVIATAVGTVPYVAAGSSGVFAPLGGSPPSDATTGVTVLGTPFLFQGPNWNAGAAGVDNNWVPNIQTLANNGTLYDIPGAIIGAVPFYGNVIAFKQNSAFLGSFVGPPNSWSWQLISAMTGAWNQESIITLSDQVVFIGSDDFYTTSGSVPQRIPSRCSEWFFNNVSMPDIASTYGTYDESEGIAYWFFVSNNAPIAGTPDLFISYNLRAQRWGKGHINLRGVPYPPTNAPASALTYFDLNNVPQQLSGPKAAMSLLTGYMGDGDRFTTLYRWRGKYNLGNPSGPVYPLGQNLAAFRSNNLGRPPVPSPEPPALGHDGWFNMRSTARYHQVSLATTGDCEIASFRFEARVAGTR